MREYIWYHTIALGLGIILDQIIGDPHGMPHPIRAIGRLISQLEKRLYRETFLSPRGDAERAKKQARRSGFLLWLVVVSVTMLLTLAILAGAYILHRYLGILVEAVLTCYVLAARSLCRESMAVFHRLQDKDLPGARQALSMIVGRDTAKLSEEDVAKAAVETVAENTSDGVIAPLLYAALGGPVLGLFYKSVNTMDSMLGYKNERYENFGFFAAKADDVCNFLPARISALCMIAGSFLLGCFDRGFSGRDAFRIWRRDRRNHTSPNSAQTESVCGGALGLRLGGTHTYKGIMVEKPSIGDEKRRTEPSDIKRANRLMFATEALAALLVIGILIGISI